VTENRHLVDDADGPLMPAEIAAIPSDGCSDGPHPSRVAHAGCLSGSESMPIGQAINDLELAIEAQTPDDCKDRVLSFPLNCPRQCR
jgi:hypothetical protein